MAEVLVLAEHTADGEVKKVTLEVLTAARRVGEPSVVWLGPGAEQAQPRLAEYGAAKVYAADSPDFAGFVTAPAVELLARLVADKSPTAVLVPGTNDSKETAARLAIKTGSGVLTDAVDVLADGGKLVAQQPNFGGAITVRSSVRAGIPIVALRPGAVTADPSPGDAVVEAVQFSASAEAKLAKVTERAPAQKGDRPDLTEAKIVVSGGRGTGSAEGFGIIEKL